MAGANTARLAALGKDSLRGRQNMRNELSVIHDLAMMVYRIINDECIQPSHRCHHS